jgi:hypothetical protein
MQKPTARSPERQRLADAIERHRERADDLSRVERAIQKISETRIEDRVGIGRARDAVSIARGAQSEILVMQALGEELVDQPDLAAAERTLAECEAKLDAGRASLKLLERERTRVSSALDLAEGALKRAVKDVIANDPALAALRAEFERTRLHLSQIIGCLLASGHEVSRVAWTEVAFVPDRAWTDALTRLREDPDAVLPAPPSTEPPDAGHRDGRRAA